MFYYNLICILCLCRSAATGIRNDVEIGIIPIQAHGERLLPSNRTTAPVLPADCVTTGNGLKNGVHCGL